MKTNLLTLLALVALSLGSCEKPEVITAQEIDFDDGRIFEYCPHWHCATNPTCPAHTIANCNICECTCCWVCNKVHGVGSWGWGWAESIDLPDTSAYWISGAEISYAQNGTTRYLFYTDSIGHFDPSSVAPGQYIVKAKAVGFLPDSAEINVPEDSAFFFNLQPE